MARWYPDLDPSSVEAVEWALWCSLLCECDKCGAMFDMPRWSEPPWNDDVMAWAKEWAPTVQSLGWSMSDDEFNLTCPNCIAAQRLTSDESSV
jgi:hypothetical protein